MDARQFIQTIGLGWYRDETRSNQVELFRGVPHLLLQSFTVDSIAERLVHLVEDSLDPSLWTAASHREKWVFCDPYNVYVPAVLVCRGTDHRAINAKDAGLVIDVASRSNHERIVVGRQIYLRSGLRTHWMIDPIEGVLQETSLEGVKDYRPGEPVPIDLDGVVYGHFDLGDIYEHV